MFPRSFTKVCSKSRTCGSGGCPFLIPRGAESEGIAGNECGPMRRLRPDCATGSRSKKLVVPQSGKMIDTVSNNDICCYNGYMLFINIYSTCIQGRLAFQIDFGATIELPKTPCLESEDVSQARTVTRCSVVCAKASAGRQSFKAKRMTHTGACHPSIFEP